MYESAVVNLRCMVLRSAPTPSFMFFKDGVALNGSETGIMIRVVNYVIYLCAKVDSPCVFEGLRKHGVHR